MVLGLGCAESGGGAEIQEPVGSQFVNNSNRLVFFFRTDTQPIYIGNLGNTAHGAYEACKVQNKQHTYSRSGIARRLRSARMDRVVAMIPDVPYHLEKCCRILDVRSITRLSIRFESKKTTIDCVPSNSHMKGQT